MTTRDTWTFNELFEGLDPAPTFVAELERLGLLRVVARDAEGAALYAADAKEELSKVLSLVELGYQPKDIAAIARKVGLPARRKRSFFNRTPVFLRPDVLAARAGVSVEQLAAWIEQDLVQPSFQTEGGEALFALADAPTVQALADLVQLQVTDADLAAFAQLMRSLDPHAEGASDPDALSAADALLARVTGRLDALKTVSRRTDKLVTTLKKRLVRARREESPSRRKASRTGRRKSVRTRARGRKGPGQ